MIRACGLLSILLITASLNAAHISAFAAGFADTTPGFWGVEYLVGPPDDAAIASVTLRMPTPGLFDFDGGAGPGGPTAPSFDAASSVGLTAMDVSFLFSGVHPSEVTLQFAPGSFVQGDRVQFGADIDGLGSKLGGALGAYGGVQISVVLEDGRTGTANFTTDTSVNSGAIVQISPTAVPEPHSLALVGAGLLALYARQRRFSR